MITGEVIDMALGTNRARNWGEYFQQIALDILLMDRRVTYRIRMLLNHNGEQQQSLWLAQVKRM